MEKSFTQDPEAGGASGVILDADKMSEAQMLRVAQVLGFPESAFLQRSAIADFKLRLFSKKQEVNSCVTATLAVAHVIAKFHKMRNPSRVVFETKIGIREVFLRENNLFMMKQPSVEFKEVNADKGEIARLLNIETNQIDDYPIEIASAGTPKLLIPIKTLEDLSSIKPDLNNIATYSASVGARGFYPFTLQTQNPHSDFHARAFNPEDGIAEDPVTGVAAAALAAYLRKHGIISKNRLVGEQGYIINRPGEIIVEIDGDNNIFVGGYVTDAGEGELEI